MILLLTRILSKIALAITVALLAGCQGGVLDPKGQVGIEEKQLIIVATVLMLLVVIPVIFMTLYFAWKYREGRNEIYEPKWSHSTKIETIVWAVPIVIIIILGVITWKSTHALDPYKPLKSDKEHINVQVVSLNWKWLFIYPDLGIATVNEVAFPADVPVAFNISSDGIMNSFFIPQLGSQIYAMAGMVTKVHLIANEPGTFKGFSSNFSGPGFTGMKFKAIATPNEADFDKWVAKVKASGNALTSASFAELAKDSENHPVEYFGTVKPGLFNDIVMKFMKDYGRVEILKGGPFDSKMMQEMDKLNQNGSMGHDSMSMDHGSVDHNKMKMGQESSDKMNTEADK
ncbi:ubiquinol oxidase subunit II [Marinomonas spartinae]|uniref:ubiquinol oxidase subunit II n=1 Tax=Marinomonas spartinae TaxID=1792290 RepID=UPI0018F195E7|nr:ubiquinol oxidase subunit II [Marinomonas spartinae]MBJ7553929.1 ubiquinol oxidase subunit II [Marinomonas spartinae]